MADRVFVRGFDYGTEEDAIRAHFQQVRGDRWAEHFVALAVQVELIPGVLNGGSEKTQKVVFVFVHGHVV